jgi:phage terminase large subunit
MSNVLTLDYDYVPAFEPIYDDDRDYYFIWGGRGSGKSYFMGDYLIDKSYTETGVYLNTREHQKNLKDSNYALIKGRIKTNNRPNFYITNNELKNQRTGTSFIFYGLSSVTEENVKSLFDVKRAHCEESQNLTDNSIRMLYPTVRENGAHAYFTFNRKDENDPVYSFFKTFNCKGEKLKVKIDGKYYYWWLHRSADAIGININYDGNPYFTTKLERDRLRDQNTLPEYEYNHIWGGEPRNITEATILKNIVVEDFEIDISRQPKFGLDLGFNDENAITQSYIYDNELYICREYYKGNLDPEQLRIELLNTPWLIGQHVIYDSSQPAMGKLFNATGRFTMSASRKNIGHAAKEGLYKYYMALYLMQFKAIHIHKTNCPNAAREFKAWSWQQDKAGKVLDKVQDHNDHTVDATIYALERDATIWFKNFIQR